MLRIVLGTVALGGLLTLGAWAAADQTAKDKKASAETEISAIVVKSDASKQTITIRTVTNKGQGPERTIELKDGVKLTDSEGETVLKLKDFKRGTNIIFVEKDGKAVALRRVPGGKSAIGGVHR